MIPSAGGIARLAGLMLAVAVLQVSGFSEIRVLGGNADLAPILVAAVALYAGSVTGSVTGFCLGLLLDLTLGQELGVSSLVLTAVGYAVGRYGEVRDPGHGLTPLPVTAAATAGYAAAFAAVSFMLAIEAPVSLLVFREMVVTVFLNTLIAMPVFGLVRRVLRPALAVDPLARRRRRGTAPEARPLGLRGMGA